MRKLLSLIILSVSTFIGSLAFSQELPNVIGSTPLSSNSASAAKDVVAGVNYFTGMPNVSIPLYSYSDKNGLSLNITAGFFTGGIRNGEIPSIIGMGWNLNAGGVVSRTVNGLPDDIANIGFMYATQIPVDSRANANKYYYDSIDSQQDVFYFNADGISGKFVIGKNKEVVVIPDSKVKVSFTTDPVSKLITSFKITATNGIKYIFSETEQTTQAITYQNLPNGTKLSNSFNSFHYSAWNLTEIISPFNTDTIKLRYLVDTFSVNTAFSQVAFVKTPAPYTTTKYYPSGTSSTKLKKISKIEFPDKTSVDFLYNPALKYTKTCDALSKIKVSDSIFRYGYLFDYDTSFTGYVTRYDSDESPYQKKLSYHTMIQLKSITPFTDSERNFPYRFEYNVPYPYYDDWRPVNTQRVDSMRSAYDHWGFFNGVYNDSTAIPTVTPYYTGAWRFSTAAAMENSLSKVILPSGGLTAYEYEVNSVPELTVYSNSVTVNNSTLNSSNSAVLQEVYNERHRFTLKLDPSVSRIGTAPLSSTCNLIVNIKSPNGLTLFASQTVSLHELFYNGVKNLYFNVPNGNYKLETVLAAGSSVTGTFSFTISWENKSETNLSKSSGGIRIKKITQRNSNDTLNQSSVIQEFKYVKEDGKTSGFMGEVPKYDYAYRQKITSTGATTDYIVITSDPMNVVSTVQSSPVGYSRVEVYNGTTTKNLGKTVYEFTDLKDLGTNSFTPTFPYTPEDIKSWGIGLPKTITVFDSSGQKIKRIRNNYLFTSRSFNTDFKSLKLGRSAATYASTPIYTSVYVNTYLSEEYFPSGGWAKLISVNDSSFFNNGSSKVSITSFEYDANYNITKTISDYDKTRGLYLERRFYYPYNYTVSGAIGKLRDSGIINTIISKEDWITGDATPRIVGGEITDFQQLPSGRITPLYSYALQSNKAIPQSTIGNFNPATLNRNATYFVKQVNFNKYDNTGNSIEVLSSTNNQATSSIYDYNNKYIIAKISNAAFNDVAAASFESDGSGNWAIIGGAIKSDYSFTGKKSLSINGATISKSLSPGTSYLLTFWAKAGASITVSTGAPTLLSAHRGWNFFSTSISGKSSISITGSGYIDEVRIHPKDANIVTYTFDPLIGITSECDANNTVIFYEYDKLNRLVAVKDLDGNIIKKHQYSDSVFKISRSPQWIGTGTKCAKFSSEPYLDSVYTDINIYSDTYQSTKLVEKVRLDCNCPKQIPERYKVIGGICTKGVRYNKSNLKIKNSQGVFVWRCTYYYEFSDSSKTADFFEDFPTNNNCPLGWVYENVEE